MKLKDKKIRIINYTRTINKNGFPEETWKPIHNGRLWAYYRHLSGKEFFASATVNTDEEVSFTINHRADVTTDMMIEYHGEFYNITRLDNFEGYKDDITAYCKLAEDQDIEVTED